MPDWVEKTVNLLTDHPDVGLASGKVSSIQTGSRRNGGDGFWIIKLPGSTKHVKLTGHGDTPSLWLAGIFGMPVAGTKLADFV